MTATPTQPKQMLTFDRFIKQLPNEDGRYELVNGEIVKILPTIRLHENVANFIENTFHDEVKRLNLNYRISGRIVLRTLDPHGKEQSRHPDVTVCIQNFPRISIDSRVRVRCTVLNPGII
jgi:Uma2 family endonuclease